MLMWPRLKTLLRDCECPGLPALRAIDTDPARWAARVKGIGNGYWRAVGTAADLLAFAEAIGQRWLKGLGFAARMG